MGMFMIDFLTSHKDPIALLANVVTIVTALGLLVAFFQYLHSIRIANRSERRASVELAARECKHFGLVLLLNVSELHEQISKSGCEYVSHCKVIKSEKGVHVDDTAVTQEDRERIQSHGKKIMEVLNGLEAFAIPFAEGVADDRVGFIECGRGFVRTLEQNMPFYQFWALKNYYRSSQVIYLRWRTQIEQEDQDRQYAQASKEFVVISAKWACFEKTESENEALS